MFGDQFKELLPIVAIVIVTFALTWTLLCQFFDHILVWAEQTAAKLDRNPAPQRCHYDYGPTAGPLTWHRHYADAAKETAQSPIDIVTSRAIAKPMLPALVWHGYERPLTFTVFNSGVGIELWPSNQQTRGVDGCVPEIASPPPTISSGDTLRSCSYRFDYICVRCPAEHTVDAERFAIELQAVHRYDRSNLSCPNTSDTLIVSYLFRRTTHSDNPSIRLIAHQLAAIGTANAHCLLPASIVLSNLCPPLADGGFYNYAGSLTFPPCTENVMWLIGRDIGAVGDEQLDAFRQIRGRDCRYVRNARPVQPLNGRAVYLNTRWANERVERKRVVDQN